MWKDGPSKGKRTLRQDCGGKRHRAPSHISKMVPPTVHLGPPNWTRTPGRPGSTWPPRLVRPPGARFTAPASWSSSTGRRSSAPAAPRRWPPGPGPCRPFCFAVPQEVGASSRCTASCSRRCTVVRDTPKSRPMDRRLCPSRLSLAMASTWLSSTIRGGPGSSPQPWPAPGQPASCGSPPAAPAPRPRP